MCMYIVIHVRTRVHQLCCKLILLWPTIAHMSVFLHYLYLSKEPKYLVRIDGAALPNRAVHMGMITVVRWLVIKNPL